MGTARIVPSEVKRPKKVEGVKRIVPSKIGHVECCVVWPEIFLAVVRLAQLLFGAIKNPHSGGFKDVAGLLWIVKWWRRRESNPRPQALYRQFYILSSVFFCFKLDYACRTG